MRPYANRAPALAIEWNYRFGGYLPSVRHVRQSGIHRGSGFFSARRIECEFDERDELMQRLIFGKLARRVAAGEIVRRTPSATYRRRARASGRVGPSPDRCRSWYPTPPSGALASPHQ